MMKAKIRSLREFLLETQWMGSLPASVRERVIADSYETFHDDKDVVARKGESVHSWIGVAEGFLKISQSHRSGRIVMFSGIPIGAWVGEGSVVKRELRHYDIIAMGRTHVVHVPRATFHWLLDTSFEFNRFVISHLNERLGQFMAMVETDRLTDPVARLSRAIGGLFNPVIYPGVGPLLKVSQEELGELAGLSRQTVNAAIKELEKAGIVRVEYGGLLVRDLSALKAFQERGE